jgi:hypothetical protein
MKSPISSHWFSYVVFLLAGMMTGMILQKYLGLGNILRAVGIPYPTVEASRPAAVLPAEIPLEYHGRMHLFILAGQSNMVGWAPIPEGEKTDSRIFVFGKDYRWRIADHPIENSFNQVDMVSENSIAGFGPAMSFAFASLERHPELVIGLIPCAKNSSGIIEWQKDLSDQTLYGSCLKRVRAAAQMGKISGLLFFQGESDAMDPNLSPTPVPHASDWSELFAIFITNFRTDLQQPDLPVVFAQLGPKTVPEAVPNWDVIKAQQASLQLSTTTMIITDDLPLMDKLHFTTESYRVIGTRFADAYWDLVEAEDPK